MGQRFQLDVLKLAGRRVEAIQARLRADPDAPATVLEQGEDRVVTETRRLVAPVTEAEQAFAARVEAGQARFARADPELAIAGDVDGADILEAPYGALGHSRQDGMEVGFTRVAPHHRAPVAGDPKAAARVQLHIRDEGIREATQVAGLVQVLERVAIEAVEAILRAEPHEALLVLRYRPDRLLGQAIIETEALEAHRYGSVSRQVTAAHQSQQQCQEPTGVRRGRSLGFTALQ